MADPKLKGRINAAIDRWLEETVAYPCLSTAQNVTCGGTPAKNHSIQNGGAIELLQRDNHVYRLAEPRGKSAGYAFLRLGRNNASVFSGYCASHDTLVFRDIDFHDMSELRPADQRQQGLFALRAFARERWAKLNSSALHSHLATLVHNRDTAGVAACLNISTTDAAGLVANFAGNLAPFLFGTNLGLEEICHRFESLRTQVATGAWHHSVFRSWTIQSEPSVAVSAVISPVVDFNGRVLTNLNSLKPVAHVALTILPTPSGTVVLLQYHRRARATIDTIGAQLDAMSEADRRIALSQLIVVNCENALYSPKLVDRLTAEERAAIGTLYGSTIASGEVAYSRLPQFNFFHECE